MCRREFEINGECQIVAGNVKGDRAGSSLSVYPLRLDWPRLLNAASESTVGTE